MPWIEKQRRTQFETTSKPPFGLFFLDGDIVALKRNRDGQEIHYPVLPPTFTADKKAPMIAFPSGIEFSLRESKVIEQGGLVTLFGALDLPLNSTRNEAFALAEQIAEQTGYIVRKKGNHVLEVSGYRANEHYRLSYDSARHRLLNVERVQPLTRPALKPTVPATETAGEIAEEVPIMTELVAEAEDQAFDTSASISDESLEPTEAEDVMIVRQAILLRLVHLAEEKLHRRDTQNFLTHVALTVLDAQHYGLSRDEIRIAIEIGTYLQKAPATSNFTAYASDTR